MKKQWTSPQICQLGIEETKGGTVLNPQADGDPWYDEAHKSWQQPVGKS
jgi:hypothetical protein